MPATSDGKDQHDRGVIVLRWLGQAFMLDVPGRDLTAEDIKAAPYTKAELVKSGAYAAIEQPAKPDVPALKEK